jgi:hypothetical protein
MTLFRTVLRTQPNTQETPANRATGSEPLLTLQMWASAHV